MKTIAIHIILIFCIVHEVVSQPVDNKKILLNDTELQFEITEAMNLMYNFRFEKADSAFAVFKGRYPNHPLPYFLLGYSQYWRTLPNEDVTSYDKKFYAYMDTVIDMAGKIYDKDHKNFEAIFFLTAAYAFNGRRLSDNKEWTNATYNGSRALHYLKLSREYNDLSPEFLFGEGLFNYFSEWIPQNYPAFKPVMWFFPKGNKNTGIKLLKEASENAFYTRTEAQHYLIRILLFEEKKDFEALPIAKYLHTTYPSNPVFHRFYARILFSLGNYTECDLVSAEILKRLEEKQPGYEETSGRYASFFMGWIYSSRNNKEKALACYEKTVELSEKIGAIKMNYYLYALSALAKFAEEKKETEKALYYHRKIKENADRKNELYKGSKKYIKEND